MRKTIISLGILTMLGGSVFVACSGDDSSGTSDVDSGTDSAVVADNYVPPKDSGPADSGPVACALCGQTLAMGSAAGPPCTDNGPPSSNDKVNNLVYCICGYPDGGPGQCNTAPTCQELCVNNKAPTADCITCFETDCSQEVADCVADGQDAGPTDAGDAGDGS